MNDLKALQSYRLRCLSVVSVLGIVLAACAPGQAGENPGPFGNPGAPGDSNTAGGPTPQIQPGGVSQTAEAPGSQISSTVVASTVLATGTAQVSGSADSASTANATAGATVEASVVATATDAIAAPTVQPAAVLTSGAITYGVVQLTLSETIVPSVTAQILPVRLEAVNATSAATETEPALTLVTGTILSLGGFTNLNPDGATYQQPRIMVMPLVSYIPADAVVVTTSLGNPFFDALRIATASNNQAIFSSSQLQQTGMFYQSPALSLRAGVTVAFAAEAQHLDFANGKGVRFVSALTEAQGPVTGDNLYYFYHGLTADERYYVAAILPIVYAPLAITATVAAGATPGVEADYDKYLSGVEEQLASGSDETFSQALADYDYIISTIRVIP